MNKVSTVFVSLLLVASCGGVVDEEVETVETLEIEEVLITPDSVTPTEENDEFTVLIRLNTTGDRGSFTFGFSEDNTLSEDDILFIDNDECGTSCPEDNIIFTCVYHDDLSVTCGDQAGNEAVDLSELLIDEQPKALHLIAQWCESADSTCNEASAPIIFH